MERIETNSTDRKLKWVRYLGVLAIIVMIIRMMMLNDQNFSGLGKFGDTMVLILIGGYFTYRSYTKEINNRLGQFIEWEDDKITFRLKEDKNSTSILKSEVEHICIAVDVIKIIKKGGMVFNLDISDFSEYEKRIRIKSNFTQMTATLV